MVQFIKSAIKSYGRLVTYSTIGSILAAAIFPFIILPFLAAHLSSHDFGQVTVLMSLVNFTQTVLTSNLGHSVYRRHKSMSLIERRIFFGKLFWLNNSLSFSAAILFIISYPIIANHISLTFELWQSAPFFIYMGFSGMAAMMTTFLSSDLDFRRLFMSQAVLFIGSFSIFGVYYLIAKSIWSVGLIIGPVLFCIILFTFNMQKKAFNIKSFPDMLFIKSISHDTFIWTLAAFGFSFLIYGDRWLMAELGFSFDQIGDYTVAVQANMLIIFAVTQISLIAVPLISNIESLSHISLSHLKKMFMLLLAMIVGVLVFGSILGSWYIKIFYGNTVWERVESIFYILIIGTSFYPIQIFSRGFLIKFSPLRLTLFLDLIAGGSLIIFALILMQITNESIIMAIAKAASFGLLGILTFIFVFLPIIRNPEFV